MRLLVRLHHRTRAFFRGQVLAQEYPQEVLIPASASISVSHSSRGVQLLRGTKVPLLPTPDKCPRKRHRFPVSSRNVNLVAFLDSAIKADLPTNIGCCRGTFVQVVLKGSVLASATTTEICNSGRSSSAHALASIRPPGSLTSRRELVATG